MAQEYSPEWSDLRRLQRRLLRLAAAGLLLVVAVPALRFFSNEIQVLLGPLLFAAFALLVFLLFRAIIEYSYWACPRCGQPFHQAVRKFGRWGNPVPRRCLHCHLPKWAEQDPDPNLKQKLNPFRTDHQLGLGNVKRL
jgi:hypothetical protein